MTNLYDEVAYPSSPFRQTHPSRLAVPAILLGLEPAPVHRCRVLEIGCGEGGNLIPMAVNYPESRFVGFDLAETPIRRGADVAAALGLSNLRLEALDLMAARPEELGTFDYIIAHGFYAWVPEPVRDAMMALVAACLSPEGLAMISYNALPGCAVRRSLRDMMLRHLGDLAEPKARIERAREMLTALVQVYRDNDPVEAAYKAEAEKMLARPPNVLFHDELGEHFRPVYLHEFAAHANRHGLSVLAEAEPMWLDDSLAPVRSSGAIRALGVSAPLEVQQYRDFMIARPFRQTIVRRGPAPTEVDLAQVARLHVALLGHPGQLNQARRDAPIVFRTSAGVDIEISDPDLKAPIAALAEVWPQALPLSGFDPRLAGAFLQFWASGLVELLAAPEPFMVGISDRPTACPLARLQAAGEGAAITTRRHGEVLVNDPVSRRFITLLDGRRSHEELAVEMASLVGQRVETVRPKLADSLEGMARLPLLIA